MAKPKAKCAEKAKSEENENENFLNCSLDTLVFFYGGKMRGAAPENLAAGFFFKHIYSAANGRTLKVFLNGMYYV